jgi:hypothetical protein
MKFKEQSTGGRGLSDVRERGQNSRIKVITCGGSYELFSQEKI